MTEKYQEAYRVAGELYPSAINWAIFYKEVLGPGGIVQKLYDSPEAMAEFQKSEEYNNIQKMLTDLRKDKTKEPKESTRVITVRLPESVHESLMAEAFRHQTSMNQLCISKLLQLINGDYVPRQRASGPRAGSASKSSELVSVSEMNAPSAAAQDEEGESEPPE